MSQISKCPKVTVVLTYWEALEDVSEQRYKSLLCFSSKRSYCSIIDNHSWHPHRDTIIDPCQDSDSDSELDIEGPSSPSDLRDEELVCSTCSTFSCFIMVIVNHHYHHHYMTRYHQHLMLLIIIIITIMMMLFR